MRTSRWPISHLPISDITPFTYRDGETYLELLNRLSQYITEQLHPNLRKTVEHMVEEMEHIIAAQHGKYVEGIQDFQRIHDAFMTDVNSALMALNDNAVTDLVNDPGSSLGQALRGLIDDQTDAVNASVFGVIGDGYHDDTNALRTALSSGKTVMFDGDKTYHYDLTGLDTDPLVVKNGTKAFFNGATLYERDSVDQFRVIIESDTYVDNINLNIAGGERARGVRIVGSNIDIDTITVTARKQGSYGNIRRRGVIIGKEGGNLSHHIRIGSIHVANFDYATALWNCEDVEIGKLTVRNYRQGMVIRDSKRWTIRSGHSDVMSPHAVGATGENAILIESTVQDYSVEDGYISNFVSNVSGEHGYRIGGQMLSRRITFEHCVSRAAGSGVGTGVEPHNHGGCGFKTLGPTLNTAVGVGHKGIRFNNCTVENLNRTRQKDNFSGFDIGKSYDVHVINPVVRSTSGYTDGGYAAYDGIALIGSQHVNIVNPNIRDCENAGIAIYQGNNVPAVHWGNDIDIQVNGGIIERCDYGFQARDIQYTIRRVMIDGTMFMNIRDTDLFQDADTDSLSEHCFARFNTFNGADTLSGVDTWVIEVKGDMHGEMVCRNGSVRTNYTTGAHQVMKTNEWVTV